MKKMMLFLFCISGHIVASPLAALEQAKQDLIAGKQKVTAGKEQVQAGYWKIKHDAVDKLTGPYDDMQSTICVVTNIDKYAGDIVTAMGLLITSILIVPPLGVAATIGTTLMVGVPEVIKSIKNVLNAISNTMGTVQGTINAANEKMNPGTLLAFAQSAAGTTAQINTIIANNTSKLKPDFVANVTNITAQLNKIIDFVKSKADPVTGLFKPDAQSAAQATVAGAVANLKILGQSQPAAPASADKSIFDGYQVDLSKAYAALSAINYGRSTKLGQDKFGCPTMGTDPAIGKVLDNAPSADKSNDDPDPKGAHPWADARGYIAVPIFDLLAQVSPIAWNMASTVTLPPMYQQFALAEQKFDLAIAKLDKIITDFKAALAALDDDGS